MKKIEKLIIISLIISLIFAFGACTKKQVVVDENSVIITVEKANEDDKLIDYMNRLKEKKEIEFKLENGMITSINNKSNTTNSFWMLYTNDLDNSNSDWGTTEYKGETFGSSTLGVNELNIKNGKIYIWVYQTF